MRAHCLQHVPFEGPGSIEPQLRTAGYELSHTGFFAAPDLPAPGDIDLLVVMGGPMSVNDERELPWLIAEKKFIRASIEAGKPVLGICLGAQLIASAMGARIYKNKEKEIGWFPVEVTAPGDPFTQSLPVSFVGFHWHGDTFELPVGATWIAKSEGCVNQAFEYDGHVFGLQFHLESSEESIHRLVDHCGHELTEGKYIQTKEKILKRGIYLQQIEKLIIRLLDQIEHEAGRRWEDAC